MSDLGVMRLYLKISRIGELGADAAVIASCMHIVTPNFDFSCKGLLVLHTLHFHDATCSLRNMSILDCFGAISILG